MSVGRALPALILLLLAHVVPAFVVSAGATAVHQRLADGWNLLAIETRDGPFTACAYLPTGVRAWPGEDFAAPDASPRSRVLDGRLLLRADGEDPAAILAALSAADVTREGSGGHALDGHVLELVRLRDRARPPGFPVLVLAGPSSPGELMAELLPVAARVARIARAGSIEAPTPASLRPRWGWWRHIAESGGTDVSVGIPLPVLSPAELPAMHMLIQAIASRLEARAPGLDARELLAHEGVVFRVAWPGEGAGAADRLRATCREVLADLVDTPPDSTEFAALHQRATHAIRIQREAPDRWFAREVIGASMGTTRATNHETLAALGKIGPGDLGPFAAAHLPADVVVVSRGVTPYEPLPTEPTERWRGSRPDSAAAAGWVMERLRRALWGGGGEPIGLCLDGTYELDADRVDASGRLEERVSPREVHRRFTPFGTGLSVEGWIREGRVGGRVLGRARHPADDESARLRARLRTDPWNLARTPLSKVRVSAGSFVAGRVYQKVETVDARGGATVYLDPRSGLPERVVRGPEAGALTSTTIHFTDYETRSGLTYPTRIEGFRGEVKRTAISVERWGPCARLAGLETLQ